mgnify:CR=1 FL=1
MADRIPIKNPVGVPGWLYLDGRILRAEFPEMPKTNKEFDLDAIDLGRLANMLLDQKDAEQTAERRRCSD